MVDSRTFDSNFKEDSSLAKRSVAWFSFQIQFLHHELGLDPYDGKITHLAVQFATRLDSRDKARKGLDKLAGQFLRNLSN